MNLADAIFSKNLIQIGDHRITQLLAIHCDCSEQYNMKQFSLTRLQKCTQSPFEIEYTRTFASVFIGAKSKSFLGSHNQTIKFSKFIKQYQIAVSRIVLNNALQVLQETPDDCEQTFLNTTNFHRFHVILLKLFSTQLNDRTDSDSVINSLFLPFSNQNPSLVKFHEQSSPDAEKLQNQVINVFTQTVFDHTRF